MTNEFKKMQKLAGLLAESEMDEAKGNSKLNAVADLYAYMGGIRSKYSQGAIDRYGKDTVKMAEEMAPRLLAFIKEMKEVKNNLKKSPEGKMLELIVQNQLDYSGARKSASMADVFNMIDSYK